MNSYNRAFARFYNQEWEGFAKEITPKLLAFYKGTNVSQANSEILDLCCGTGRLAQAFLREGFQVTGIDLSEDMLFYARENNRDYIQSGQANFITGDISNFCLAKEFGLVVSTYDSINHLEDERALFNCFKCVFPLIIPGGYFIFDLNTYAALSNWKWHSISIIDREDLMMVSRGIFDKEHGRALFKCSGYIQVNNTLYEKFEQTIVNTAFSTEKIKNMLNDLGWTKVHFAVPDDLSLSIADPELIDEENGVLVIAQK
jgi:SAM-dependent methyltransferase